MKKAAAVVANIGYGGRYRERLQSAAQTGRCIFCGDRIQKKGHLKTIGGWILRFNRYPTKDREKKPPKYHFLIIPRRHFLDYGQLEATDHKAIDALIRWARKRYEIRGGGLFHRLGDPDLSGATILHFHMHFVVPRRKNRKTVPVDMPVG